MNDHITTTTTTTKKERIMRRRREEEEEKKKRRRRRRGRGNNNKWEHAFSNKKINTIFFFALIFKNQLPKTSKNQLPTLFQNFQNSTYLTKSIAPPIPLTIFPGIIQFARSPFAPTCNAPKTVISTFAARIMAKDSEEENNEDPGIVVTFKISNKYQTKHTHTKEKQNGKTRKKNKKRHKKKNKKKVNKRVSQYCILI